MPVIIAGVIGAATQGIGAATGSSGTAPPGVDSSYSQSTVLPDWYTNEQQQIVNGTNDAVSNALGIEDPNTFKGYIHNAGQGLQTAMNTIGTVSDPSLDANVFSSYMDPYTEGVVNQIQTLGNRNLMENVLPGVNDTFTSAGQFGGDRNGEFEARAIRDNQQAISNAQAGALEAGFNTSLGAYNAGENRTLNAGTAQGQVATATGNLGAQYQNTLGQAINQQLAPRVAQGNIVNGMQMPNTISGAGKAPLPGATYGPSTASQLGGAATQLGAAYNALPGSTPSGTNPATGNSYATDFAGGVIPMRRGGLAKAKAKRRGGALTACAA